MNHRTLRLALLLLLSVGWTLVPFGEACAANWPRFRGPNGSGIAADTGIPLKWNATEGVLWKTELPGMGNSSPIIWNNDLFLQSATPDGKERMLLCLSVADGSIRWVQKVPGAIVKTNERNTLASSTPATDGERVYALFWNGTSQTMTCYDFQGKLLWQRELGKFVSQHGAGHSPMIYEGKVIVMNDQDGSANLLALNCRTGEIAWNVPRLAFRASYSTPFVLERPGEMPELIVTSTEGVTGYDPKSGSRNWHWNWKFTGSPLRTVGSPVFANGMVFIGSGDGGGARHMVAVKVGSKADPSKAALAWENKKTLPYVPCMLTVGEHVYFVNDRGIAGCADMKTGNLLWTERLADPAITASPVLIDGKVYAINEEGEVFVFPASPTYKLLAKNAMEEPVLASPAVANNRLYIRGQKHLFCIGAK